MVLCFFFVGLLLSAAALAGEIRGATVSDVAKTASVKSRIANLLMRVFPKCIKASCLNVPHRIGSNIPGQSHQREKLVRFSGAS
jgi:hypothetical protein